MPTPARDYKHMRQVMGTILTAWAAMPGLRLGQLLDNAVNRAGAADMFNVEDGALIEDVKKFRTEFGPKEGVDWVKNGM